MYSTRFNNILIMYRPKDVGKPIPASAPVGMLS